MTQLRKSPPRQTGTKAAGGLGFLSIHKVPPQNLRGTTTEEMCKRENCTEKEAQMYMIFEDCQDMGIKMNIAYADRLTGASDEREQMARLEKQFPTQQATYQTETLPGRTRLTREEVAAKYTAQK